jgi:Asp-tRNA(Asn)/Glu-tRNA(Gln) amidotransferase A subunit family amidase
VNFLTTKGLIMDGGLNNQNPGDRAGIHCRTVEDAALVLDAIKGYETEDMFSAIPKALIPDAPYASFVVADDEVAGKPLAGMRVAVVREFMVKHTKNDIAISDRIDNEIKTVLRDKLGAELVESIDPLYPDDPDVPNMTYTFADAFAEILPHTMAEYFWQTTASGELKLAVPGWDVTSVDYAVALAAGKAPLSPNINIRSVARNLASPRSPLVINKYLAERGDRRITDWASWVANATWISDAQRAGSENAVHDQDHREDSDGVSYLKMREALRMVVLKVMYENGIDAFVNPEITLPPFKLGGPVEPAVDNRTSTSCCSALTALLGSPEINLPAGYTDVVYEPSFVLSADRKRYETETGDTRSTLPHPMPISLMIWSAPGSDADVIKIASAYEAATHHRVPPPDFGPLD